MSFDQHKVALPGILWKPVLDLVVIALLRDKDMHRQRSLGWTIEDAHRHSSPVVLDRVPEQCRTAGAAETSSDLFRRLIPADSVFALHMQP